MGCLADPLPPPFPWDGEGRRELRCGQESGGPECQGSRGWHITWEGVPQHHPKYSLLKEEERAFSALWAVTKAIICTFLGVNLIDLHGPDFSDGGVRMGIPYTRDPLQPLQVGKIPSFKHLASQ